MAYIYYFTSQRTESQFWSVFFTTSPVKKHQYKDQISVFSDCAHFNLAQFPSFRYICQGKHLCERDMSNRTNRGSD